MLLPASLLGAGASVVLPAWGGTASTAYGQADPVVVAAGDIACSPRDPNFAGGNTSLCQMRATESEISGLSPQYLLPLGDEQYGLDSDAQGTQPQSSDYTGGYDATWGALSDSRGGPIPNGDIFPVAGSHDYGDVNDSDSGPLTQGSGYFANFGSSGLDELPGGVGGPSSDWYSQDIPVNGGTWHVVALDAECSAIGGCGSGSPEERFLAADLAAHRGDCTVITMHEPRFAVGPLGDSSVYSAIWDDAVANHVVALLAGHDHDYEDFAPMNTSGRPSTGGTAEFVVGTGGKSLDSVNGSSAGSGALRYKSASSFGALRLTLHASSADYAFQTTSGQTADSGTLQCLVPPTVSGVSPTGGPRAGGNQVTITGSHFSGATEVDFGGQPAPGIQVGSDTSLTATVPAGPVGTVDVTVTTPGGTSAPGGAATYTYLAPGQSPPVFGSGGSGAGYWMVGSDGGVFAFGSAPYLGSLPGDHVKVSDIVGVVPTSDNGGYWMVGRDGGVFAFGDAGFKGSLPGDHVKVSDIVGVVPTSDGGGYWMVGSDGGVFAFGDASFLGSLPGDHVSVNDIVGVVPTHDNGGYWMVGRDGGVFAFGDAGFKGSLPGDHVSVTDVRAVVPTSDGNGYWMVGSDGGVFAFGDAGFVGSLPGDHVSVNDVVGAVGTHDNGGYWMVGSDGGVFAFGDATFVGSLPGVGVTVHDIVAVVPA